jgi:hypothetical protein
MPVERKSEGAIRSDALSTAGKIEQQFQKIVSIRLSDEFAKHVSS